METCQEYLFGEEIDDELTEYFDTYTKENDEIYSKFSETYIIIKQNKKLYTDVNYILNHPVKLMIHKRWDLLDLCSQEDLITLKDKGLKQFIEYLLIHGLDELNKMFIHTFISLKELRLRNQSKTDIILSSKDIIHGLHEFYFESQSDYIRDISFYDEYNPKLHRILLKKEFMERHVSFYTKYPQSLKALFGGKLKVIKNIVSDESNDSKLLYDLLLTIDPSITIHSMRGILKEESLKEEKSFQYHNLLENNKYKSNDELILDLEDLNYYITPYDLKILSLRFTIGFVLYTNRFTDQDKKFQTLIIIHKNLIKEVKKITELSLPMLCFYQDFSEEETNNKELKPIEMNDQFIIHLTELQKNKEFRRILSKTYKI